MISDNLKCIYIHIPKTGGMSIESILGEDLEQLHKLSIKIKHGTPKEWKYLKYWKHYFKFTFVRNPWDRVVSAYLYNLKMSHTNTSQHDREKIKQYGIDGFNEYVLNDLQETSSRFFLPCSHWIKGYDYDFIGKLENFQRDMSFICNRMGINYVPTHLNMTSRDKYSKYYNKDSKEKIKQLYKDDIEMFDYQYNEL